MLLIPSESSTRFVTVLKMKNPTGHILETYSRYYTVVVCLALPEIYSRYA